MKQSVLFLLLLSLFVGSAHAADYDVYIMAGQSNMDGRGDVADLSEPFASEQVGTLIYYTNPANPSKKGEKKKDSSGWQTLKPGYSVPPGARGKELTSHTFGPELSFAYAMGKAQNRPVAIIKITRGGTNLRSDWSPKGFMYLAMLDEVKQAMQAMADRGDSGVLRGMLWHQGESDASKSETYQKNLEMLIANSREAFAVPDLPFLIGELAPTKPASFRALQKAIAEENDNVFFVSSKDLETTDRTHFDTASQIKMGQRFAEVMAKIMSPSEHQAP